jgi:hypothetical protein
VPCLLINDDTGTAVENLLDAYTQRLTNSETTRTTKDEKHTHLRFDCRRVGKVVHHFNWKALAALLLLDDLRDEQNRMAATFLKRLKSARDLLADLKGIV